MAPSRYERVFQWQLWTCLFSFCGNVISAALCFANYMLLRVTITLGPHRCNPPAFNNLPPPPDHPALPDRAGQCGSGSESEDYGADSDSSYDRSVYYITYYEASESEPNEEDIDDVDSDDNGDSTGHNGNDNGHDGDGGSDSDATSDSDSNSISWYPIPPSTAFFWSSSS